MVTLRELWSIFIVQLEPRSGEVTLALSSALLRAHRELVLGSPVPGLCPAGLSSA